MCCKDQNGKTIWKGKCSNDPETIRVRNKAQQYIWNQDGNSVKLAQNQCNSKEVLASWTNSCSNNKLILVLSICRAQLGGCLVLSAIKQLIQPTPKKCLHPVQPRAHTASDCTNWCWERKKAPLINLNTKTLAQFVPQFWAHQWCCKTSVTSPGGDAFIYVFISFGMTLFHSFTEEGCKRMASSQ